MTRKSTGYLEGAPNGAEARPARAIWAVGNSFRDPAGAGCIDRLSAGQQLLIITFMTKRSGDAGSDKPGIIKLRPDGEIARQAVWR